MSVRSWRSVSAGMRDPGSSATIASYLSPVPLTPELHELARRVSNWGRWGADDQRGTLNLITDRCGAAGRRRGPHGAARSRSRSRSTRPGRSGTTRTCPNGSIPELRTYAVNITFTGDTADFTTSDDSFRMGSQAATHLDALAHVGYEGKLWNDTPSSVVSADGRGPARDRARRRGRDPRRAARHRPAPRRRPLRRQLRDHRRRPRAARRRPSGVVGRAGRRGARAHRADALPARGRQAPLLDAVARPVDQVDRVGPRPRRRARRDRHDHVRGATRARTRACSCPCT